MENKISKFVLGAVFISIFLFTSVSAEDIDGIEWRVLNITEEGNVSNYTINPEINNSPQFDVLATMDATLWWAEVQLNTTQIDFGNVKARPMFKYRIKQEGL